MAATVLLVDDSRDLRTVYATMLEYGGFVVIDAGASADAHRLARDRQPQVVVLDSELAGEDGWELALLLSGDPRTAAVPLIMLCERGEAAPPHAASVELLMLVKPVEPRVLLSHCRELARRDTRQNGA